MEAENDISTRSTKNEILDAYHELLGKVKSQKIIDRQAEKKKVDDQETVKSVSGVTTEAIAKGVAGLKFEMAQTLDGLEHRLMAEYKKFSDLQHAVEIENAQLEEIHEIKINADSLAALLLAQKEKKAAFETEMTGKRSVFEGEMGERREQWTKEQETFELTRKERDAQVKKDRQREDEEYTYNLQLKRKKDNDAYETRKAAMEKELTEKKAVLEKEWAGRESTLKAREQELVAYKARADAFPKEIEEAVKNTEKTVTERMAVKQKFETDLFAKEIEGERKLSKQMITALEAKIKEQDEQIRQLTGKANESVLQVQHIAIKAIEGASTPRIYAAANCERPLAVKEPAKG